MQYLVFNWESCKRLYPTVVLFLMFMLFLNIIHIGFLGFLPLDEEVIEFLEIGFFFLYHSDSCLYREKPVYRVPALAGQ